MFGLAALLLVNCGGSTVIAKGTIIAASGKSRVHRSASSASAEIPSNPIHIKVTDSALPLGLEPDTCLEYRPTRGNNKRIVFVDPGHGGLDPGALGVTESGATVYEKDITLAVGLDLLSILRSQGYTVVMSRVTDTSVANLPASDFSNGVETGNGARLETVARVDCANAAHAQVLLGIYMDAFYDPTAVGCQTYWDNARSFSGENQTLATLVQNDLIGQFNAQGWDVYNRGTLPDDQIDPYALTPQGQAYGHLLLLGPYSAGWMDNPSQMPGVISEPLFITNPQEGTIAASTAGQEAMARGFAQGAEQFFAQLSSPASSGSGG